TRIFHNGRRCQQCPCTTARMHMHKPSRNHHTGTSAHPHARTNVYPRTRPHSRTCMHVPAPRNQRYARTGTHGCALPRMPTPNNSARWRRYQHRRKRAARPDAALVRPRTSQHRSMRARAPLVRLCTHGPHDPHAGAGTSTGACAPVCAARPPLRTRAARTHISVHGATARIMAELARGRWHVQSGRERDTVPNMHTHWAVGGRAAACAVAADGAHASWT
ncbi:hypothetical protein GGX14DRAFT_442356, partial [Mycena pura]